MSPTVIYIIAGYALILLLVYLVQEKIIFKPEKLSADFKYQYDAPFKELFFDPEPGVRINGLHFTVRNPKGLILYFHGNSRSIKGWAKYAKDFYRYQYDVVLVDYRGFGKSTGKRSEAAMLKDMQFVYDTLAAQYPEHHLVVYGRSMGSGFATKLASDNSPRYLILDAPYFSPFFATPLVAALQVAHRQMDSTGQLPHVYHSWHQGFFNTHQTKRGIAIHQPTQNHPDSH
jgi:uncharacterized protein